MKSESLIINIDSNPVLTVQACSPISRRDRGKDYESISGNGIRTKRVADR